MDLKSYYDEMRYLIDKLDKYDAAYEEGHPLVSDAEYDELYFKLARYENMTNFAYPDSPTQRIKFNIVSKLEKIEHNHPMLSLAKTKEIDDIVKFYHGQSLIFMPKLDGLTCSLTYEDGKLIMAETRGNGQIGENVLHNAQVIPSIPRKIPYKGKVSIDGEVICLKNVFKQFESEYKNPRNFAAGSIRLLDSNECMKRRLTFVPWDVPMCGIEFDTLSDKLHWLQKQTFKTVPMITVPALDIYMKFIRTKFGTDKDEKYAIQYIFDQVLEAADEASYPIDGIVIKYNNVKYYESLGNTDHHFKGGIAYKMYDETYPTRLRYIHWTMGRTGVLTPVAVFDPIEIDGSVVERASLHNVSVMRETLGSCAYVGEPLEIYKANMIIPQVAKAGPKYDYGYVISHGGVSANDCPERCPVCGSGDISIHDNDGVKVLMCDNPSCEGKLINKIDHYCSKKGLDIKGLSDTTIEKLMNYGWIDKISDIYKLKNHRIEWILKPGFGEKSVDNILTSIENSRKVALDSFISSLGIPLIGENVAKELVKYVDSYDDFREKVKNHYNFSKLDTFGESKTESLWNFDYEDADYIVSNFITFLEKPKVEQNDSLKNITIVITGKLKKYKNRAALEDAIRAAGGKISGSVSKNTNYLINNDTTSTSSKNLTAQKLGVEIISEEDFINKFLT